VNTQFLEQSVTNRLFIKRRDRRLRFGFPSFPHFRLISVPFKGIMLTTLKHETRKWTSEKSRALSLSPYLYTVCRCAPELLNHKLIIYLYRLAVRELGHLLTRSGLDRLDVLLTVLPGFFMHVGCIFNEKYISLFSVHMLNPAGFVL
jgi:hypothetical protein